MYPLDEVLLLCLLAVLAGAETITDIARFGDKKLHVLRHFAKARQPMTIWATSSPASTRSNSKPAS